MSTHDPVRFWAAVQPERAALRSPRSFWTYRELDRAVWAASDALLEKGLGAGEHVSLEFGPGDPVAFAVALHAVQRIGSLPVIVGAHLTPLERQTMRERAQVEFTLTAGDLDIPHLDGAPPPPAGVAPPIPSETPRAASPDIFLERRLDAPAAVCFTSGTSGEPRAVVLTHGNFLWSAIASARNLGVRAGDLWLCPMPLHHVGGLSILARSALYGTAALLHERFDADAVHHAIDEEGVTLLSLVPTMLIRLLEARRGRPYPESLRAVLVGGGPIPPAALENAAALRMRALPTYGLTEAASQVTTLPLREWPRGLSTAGRPLPFAQVEIRDLEDRPARPGVEGEILVRGPTVMAGYLGDPAATQAAFSRRWLRTGDVGQWDPDGRLVVMDRRADRIVTGGENVSPEEVERVISTHPSVAAACVVAVPSREWGQEVAAAVELRPGRTITLEELRAHAGGTLSGFKLPRHLITAGELPRSPSGKLLRRVVRERFLDEMAKQKHP
ncbi:MAG TPA: AMP-binding protein [Candidatus Limnocylindrales bacterium]|nr:AMP-binding protein [Candidatus Limnocylindrales bacterium]